MDTETFLQGVLGSAGYYCVLAIKDGRKVQKFYPTVSAMQHAAANFDDNGFDAYYALATFYDDVSREAENVQEMRSFFMDLDCGVHLKTGKPKEFPTQMDAIAALRKFCKTNRLPRPTMVSSGYGVHVYWPLTAPVAYTDWFPVAEKLKALAKAQGFNADPNVTSDAARVLRVPGTRNHKSDTPAPVSVLGVEPHLAVDFDTFSALLSNVVIPAKPKNFVPAPQTSALMNALMGSREASFRTILEKTARGNGCSQLKYIIENRTSLSEPMWRAGLSIAKFCSDSAKAARIISEGHPDYDADETAAKMERIKGPYLCTSFDEYNPGGCAHCQFNGKIKSPISLGNYIKEAEPEDNVVEVPAEEPEAPPVRIVIPEYPEPYFRGAHGGVYMRVRDEDGEMSERLIWNTDIYVVRRLTDPEQGEVVEMRHHLPRDGVRTFVVPLYVVTSKEEFRKALAAQGVAAINKEVDALMAYTQTWVKELQYTTQADNAHRQFGWTSDMKGFVLGDRVIFADRIEHNAPSASTRELMSCFTPGGDIDGWREAVAFYNKPGFELHQFMVCAGFGSVLMRFMPVNAALIHIWSKESGFGKTHALYAALSIWGDPAMLLLKEDDTGNSRMNRADVMHSLPVCMDEITNIHPREGSDLIYKITGGRQRNRMSSNGNTERYRGDPWNLIFLSSANTSLIDKVAMAKAMPKAEAQRVLEIETTRLFTQKSDKELTDAFSKQLQSNYGHAGVIFVEYVLNHMQEVKLLVETVQKQIDRAANLGPENRFWSAAAASSIAAAVICSHLKLLPYNVKALREYVVQRILQDNKTASSDMLLDPMELVTTYTYENWGRILQIKSTLDMRGAHNSTKAIDDLVVPDQQPRTSDMVGRYETDLKRLYLLPKPFKEWLAEQQINYNSVVSDLKKGFGARKVKMRLTKGTKMNLPAVDSLEIHIELDHPDGASDK